MIKVINIKRKKAVPVILALVGITLCLLGFGNIAGKITAWRENIPVTRQKTGGEEYRQAGKSIGGGVPVESNQVSFGTGEDIAQPNENMRDSYFVEYRMERERVRGMEMETMREVLASPETAEEVRKSAQERLMQLSNNISREMELENLIRARGFRDAAVFLDENTATVVVQAGDTISVQDSRDDLVKLVANITGLDEDRIIIISRE